MAKRQSGKRTEKVKPANTLDELIRSAKAAEGRAIVPRSACSVGASVMDATGRTWTAGSVSTEDWIVGECAERIALFYAITNGADRITNVVISSGATTDKHMIPCGMCLEAIRRFGPKAQITIVRGSDVLGSYSIDQLLPAL